MTKYTEEQLLENYNTFIALIKGLFSGERCEKLLKLYNEDEFGYRLVTAPASSKEHYHSAYPGGYLVHINNVYKASLGIKKMWEYMGGIIDFTDEELAFSVINHDLGKLGDKELGEYYLPQDNEWNLKNRGEVYKINTDLQFMTITDRSLYNLQQYNISCTNKEYLAIRLSQGLYDEANKIYMINYNPDNEVKTNLVRVVQMANYIACRTECDKWKLENI